MSDPVSLAGTAAGLISLGIQVTQSLVEFYNSYKSQDSALASLVERLESLSDIFRCLEKTLLDRKVQAGEQSLIKSIETSIKSCDELISELQEECQKFHKARSNGIATAVRVAGRRATYPFRQSTLQKLDEGIGEIRDNLSSALDVLQLRDNRRTQDSIAEVKVLLDLVRSHQISTGLRDWLKAPDATINHNAACAQKHPGTGMWLVKSLEFSRWLTEQNSILWLNGFPGSGKSVLCSTAIQFALRHRASDPSVGIAFFYFTFSDESKRDESGMLRALLLQLSGQLQAGETDLTKLHHTYKDGIPPSVVLIEHLRCLIQKFDHVYIALDGLDESPRDGPRGYVLDTLNAMRDWGIQGLHLFVTSRDEPDIRNSLDLYSDQQVAMWNTGVNKDIADSISARLDTDRKLRQWLPYREKIQKTLTIRAKGVFRWVECQFRSLQFCPRSEDHLDCFLNSLPQSLDETYERMLCNINHLLVEDARRILTLLCFAARPLTVEELIDGVAVQINDPPGLNYKRRLQGFDDLQAICPSFINIDRGTTKHLTEIYDEAEDLTPTVQIAHFSVQEYLESERIHHQKAAIFSLSSFTAHAEIAKICLVYLLEPGLSSKMDRTIPKRYPLAYFAAMHWNRHYQKIVEPAPKLDELILRLFLHQDSFAHWVTLHNVDQPWNRSITFDRKAEDGFAAPVYYASLLGLDDVFNGLIKTANVEKILAPAPSLTYTPKISRLVNAQGGRYGNALQAASRGGHEKTVQLLLVKGADVNAEGGDCGSALQAASLRGDEKIVQLLLVEGADVNAEGGMWGNALRAASLEGHEKIVQLLLDKGANVNAEGGMWGSALEAASLKGHEKIVQLLLDKGANVNAEAERCGNVANALQAASLEGHEKILQLLLDKGADVNAEGGDCGNALQAASLKGHEKIVQLLLDKGANVNAEAERCGNVANALQAASLKGHEKIVQLLLNKGANVNAGGEGRFNALQAASFKGHEKIVQLLLDKGADANAEGGEERGNALQAASFTGHQKIVQLLLDRGADVNAESGRWCNALQAASLEGHEKIVQLLLDKGADVNAEGGEYGHALQAASLEGHEKIVQLLLDQGADVNAEGGEYGHALHAASVSGDEKMVQLLLDKGADVNAEGGRCGNALQAASLEGHEKIVQLLLDQGADVNAEGGRCGNALQAASLKGHEKIVQLLLDQGADVNTEGGEYGHALRAASLNGDEKIVQLLLDQGADVKAEGGRCGNALQAASLEGHEKIVQLLLDKGADVNAEGGEYGHALQAASLEGHEKIVQLLLDQGADVNAEGGEYGHALHAASVSGDEKMVQLLLDKGADVNAEGGVCGNALHAALIKGHEKTVQLLLDKGADFNAETYQEKLQIVDRMSRLRPRYIRPRYL